MEKYPRISVRKKEVVIVVLEDSIFLGIPKAL